MKILKIAFKNINSLRGEHSIDFTVPPFTVSPLFAITGPTGSGKSTILDVISLALFNQVPRLGKISKNEIIAKGAILTRNQKEAFARVTYQCSQGVFASEWSISTNRNDKLRDYEMQLEDVNLNTLFDLKKSDVPAKNEELIGLSYNQFIKSVLLAQGEFAEFLKANKKDRGELLEKITGTSIYRMLGQMAFERHKEENKSILKQTQSIETFKSQLLENDILKAKKESFSLKEKHCAVLKEEIAQFEKDIELKNNIVAKKKQLEEINSKKDVEKVRLSEFEKNFGTKLSQHEKLLDFSDSLRKWDLLKTSNKEIHSDIEKKKVQKVETTTTIQTYLLDAKKFISSEVDSENVESKIQLFTKKIQQFQEQKTAKLSEYSQKISELNSETKELDFQYSNKEDNLKVLENLKSLSDTSLSTIKNDLKSVDLQNIEDEKFRLKNELQIIRKAESTTTKLNQFLENLNIHSEEIKKYTSEKSEFPKQIKLAETNEKLFSEKIEKLNLIKVNQNLQKDLEQLRKQLKEDAPCPLCGSLDHPFAEHLPEVSSDLDKEIKEANDKKISFIKETSKLKSDLDNLEKAIEKLSLKEKQLKLEILKEENFLKDFIKNLKVDSNSNWTKLIEKYENKLESIEAYDKENKIAKSISHSIPLIIQLEKITSEGKNINEELRKWYSGTDITKESQDFLSKWISLSKTMEAISTDLKKLNEKFEVQKLKFSQTENQLSKPLETLHFKNIEEAYNLLLPDQEYNKLRKDRTEITTKIDDFASQLKLLNSQLKDFLLIENKTELPELQNEIHKKKEEFSILDAECKELDRQLKNHSDIFKKIAALEIEIEEKLIKIRRWKLLDELIGDAKGNKFNDFAQDLTLEQLLYLANIRLSDLNDRYTIDKPKPEEDESLVAIDNHMGGQRRSVKTLSGGETFVLSLSMALALSDLASRNVTINSLFIDEGFGTLDPETLDQTLDTLERLQSEASKTIGIISHVDSLKERINTQIKLTRNGQGYSSLEIV